jgi:hypothetical protein
MIMKILSKENLSVITAFILACGFLFVEQDGAEQRFFCYVSFAFLSFPMLFKVIKFILANINIDSFEMK